MLHRPTFSLIVPTRARPVPLRRFLDSIVVKTRNLEQIEVILVIDDDDESTRAFREHRLAVHRVIGPPGRTMGSLNSAGYAAATGDYIMLLNDDVVLRTPGWDTIALACFAKFPDPFALIHVNDTLMKDHLCTFPLVSRRFCELAGGICPQEYIRYRIDDHIEDVFNLLAAMGERRVVYLPDIIFEHTNAVEHPEAGKVYQSDPIILAQDAPKFDAMFEDRKKLALRILAEIQEPQTASTAQRYRAVLETCRDPFALRTQGRQHIVRTLRRRRLRQCSDRVIGFGKRLHACLRHKGVRGLFEALQTRFLRRRGTPQAEQTPH